MKKNIKNPLLLSLCAIITLNNHLHSEEKLEQIFIYENKLFNTTEGTNSYTTGSMNTSTKLDLSIKDTPQSVSVVTTQELKDKNITTNQKLLDEIPGITLNRIDESISPTSRGFAIDYFKIDGMTQYGFSSPSDLDLAMFDRIEIVRGANGLTTGSGNPAISLNYIRKHANSKEFKGDLTLSAGSWDNYLSMIDVSSALNEKGNIRGRIIVKHQEEDSFMNKYEKEKNLLYGIIDVDLTDTTYFSVGGSFEKLDKNGVAWGGLPAFDINNNRIDFNRSQSVTEDWTYTNTQTTSFFTNVEQYITDKISLNANYSFANKEKESKLLWFMGQLDTTDGSGMSAKAYEGESRVSDESFDLNSKIPFTIANLDQEFILGYSYNKYATLKNKVAYLNDWDEISIPNFYNYYIEEIYPKNSEIIYRPLNHTTQTAFYINQKISLLENLKLILGARLSKYTLINEDPRYKSRTFRDELTPYAGIVYNINEQHSIYVSYTDIFQPQSQRDINDNYLDPIVGKNYETGIKGEYFDGKLNSSFSLFKILQDNVAESIDGVYIPGTSTQAYRAAKGVESKGFDFILAGNITDKLNIKYGISNFSAENAQGEKYSTKSSRTTSNLFTTYKIGDFKIGAGLNYKSRFYTGEGKSLIEQKSYILTNALLAYDVDKNSKIQLNVNNIFDKKYYEGIGSDGMIYGAPRNGFLTYKYIF